MGEEALEEGSIYEISVRAKNMHGEGIGNISGNVVFVKNAKTRVGKAYKVRITKVYRTFAYGELAEEELENNSKYFIGNGSLVITS
ncbi:MAG: TRAM domain-containing protein [Candidatus Micrarchaeaceae archaeon]